MGQLRVQQADGVAPRAESARPILYASFPRYLGDFVLWNKIANLAQKVKPTTCWFDCFFLFHPCRVAGSKRQANTFFHFLWDGCGSSFNAVAARREIPAFESALGVRGSRIIKLTVRSNLPVWSRRGVRSALQPFHRGSKSGASLRPS